MFDKVYKALLWLGVFFGCIYFPTRIDIFGFIGAVLIFILAIITVIHDYKHGTMPFQKQRDFLREQGLSLRKSNLKRNTQKKEIADPHAGMKKVKKRDTDNR